MFTLKAQPPAGGQGQKPAAPPAPMEIKQVKPGLYMVTGMGGNSTVRVGNQGIILVDTKNLGDQFYNDLVAKIKTVSDQPIKHVFVTHVHQDHSGNIGKFTAAGVEVIAHEGLKSNLETGGPKGTGYESAAGKPAPPSTTYSKEKKMSLGNIRAAPTTSAQATPAATRSCCSPTCGSSRSAIISSRRSRTRTTRWAEAF